MTFAVDKLRSDLASLGLTPVDVDFAARGFHLDCPLTRETVVDAAKVMEQNGFAMDAVTGVDWMASSEMEVVYDFLHPTANFRCVLRIRMPRDRAVVPTISGVYPGANWHERETAEMLGIDFAGHPNLIPLLLPEDAKFHPLRKDFAGL